MNKRSLFKLIIYVVNWIKLTLIAFPFVAALISMKQGKLQYGYDFLTVDHNWSIIISIGLGMVLNTWHAISFEEVGNIDPKQYLKMRQRFWLKTTGGLTMEAIRSKMQEFVKGNKRAKVLADTDNQFKLQLKNGYGFKDIIELNAKDGGIEIYSRPKSVLNIVDMARNLKNVKTISSYLIKK